VLDVQADLYELFMDFPAVVQYPTMYISFGTAGPLPAQTFCSDSGVYSACRSYSRFSMLLVGKFQDSALTHAYFLQLANTRYPESVPNSYAVQAYCFEGQTATYSASFSRDPAKLKPALITATAQSERLFDRLGGQSSALLLTAKMTSLRLTLTSFLRVDLPGLVLRQTCTASVAGEPTVKLACLVTGTQLKITSKVDYTTTNQVRIVVGLTNPTSGTPTLTFSLYKDAGLLQAQGDVIFSPDYSLTGSTLLPRGTGLLLPFYAKLPTASNAPIRFTFRTSTAVAAASTGSLVIDHPRISQAASTTGVQCFLIRYSALGLPTGTYLHVRCSKPNAASTQVILDAPKRQGYMTTFYYEVVILPLANVNVLPGSVITTGFEQLASVSIVTIRLWTGYLTGMAAYSRQRWQPYLGTSLLVLDKFYITSVVAATQTKLYFRVVANFASAGFPDSILLLRLPQLAVADMDHGQIGRTFPCEVTGVAPIAGQTVQCNVNQEN
jgi:hypothetical protein